MGSRDFIFVDNINVCPVCHHFRDILMSRLANLPTIRYMHIDLLARYQCSVLYLLTLSGVLKFQRFGALGKSDISTVRP